MLKVVVLSGGIGGAKLALGMSHAIAPENLTVIANTGDDFDHLGLRICPDIDTLTYTLAGVANAELGWGRRDETWTFMGVLETLGGETWFRLGDGDLALHIERTRRLKAGETLSAVTDEVRRRFGIGSRIVPATDDVVATRVEGNGGWLDFQDYFVRLRCEPAVRQVAFAGAEAARPSPAALAALGDPDLGLIVIAPSNPLISIGPMLAVDGLRQAIARSAAPVIAVSPIIGGAAVKGPTAKMMRELGMEVSAAEVARRYADLIDGYIVDTIDEEMPDIGVPVVATRTLMVTLEDRVHLAHAVLAFSERLREARI